jgi:hypothetical protein
MIDPNQLAAAAKYRLLIVVALGRGFVRRAVYAG